MLSIALLSGRYYPRPLFLDARAETMAEDSIENDRGSGGGGGEGGRGRTHARTHLARANLVDSINEAHAPRVLRPSIIIPCFFIDVASAKGRATRSFYSENTNLAPGRCERERNGAPALQ